MEATRSLDEDHRVIEVMLPALEGMARRMERGQFASGEEVARALEFLREFVDAYHHGKEERVLFPALEARGVPRQSGLVFEVLKEHGEGRRHVRAMAAAVGEEVGADVGAEYDFGYHAREYVVLLRRHIAKEDSALWPLAESVLTAEDDARLVQGYAEIERRGIGAGGRERYRKVAEEAAEGVE